MEHEIHRNGSGSFFVNGQKVKHITGLSGGYRFVGETADGLIFKADVFEKAFSAFPNQTECELEKYEEIEVKDKHFFPEILASGLYDCPYNPNQEEESAAPEEYAWLIEEKIPIDFGVEVTEEIEEILSHLKDKYNLNDLMENYAGCILTNTENWTIIDGLPMIYDFGL